MTEVSGFFFFSLPELLFLSAKMKFVSGPENVLTLEQTKVAVEDVMSSVSADGKQI